jgi:predicted enzyme related to lactoylglutathione lyase
MSPKPNHLAHFAINADDVDRAKRFYGGVFGWRFEAWGPPEFFMIKTKEGEDPGTLGSLQKRHHPKIDGASGVECTIAVASVDQTARKVAELGGTVTLPRMTIGTVGHLIQFRDTEGNAFGAMEYDEKAT